jgi:hypothetical protein
VTTLLPLTTPRPPTTVERPGARPPREALDGGQLHLALHLALDEALDRSDDAVGGLTATAPRDERDELLVILSLTDLHLAPIDHLGARVRFQHHPGITELKLATEQRFLARLDAELGGEPAIADSDEAVARVRAVAAEDAVPPIYEWVEGRAEPASLQVFLALEGGPDAGFDDLVAIAQVGLAGEPKLEMARNYWDEMGRGDADEVHAVLHHRMADAAALMAPPRQDHSVPALARAALGAVLATNRALQPELVGALGLIELQAGPRCRRVLGGLRRCGAPGGTLPFYDEHARTDPRHGKDWLDRVIAPLAEDERWAAGIVRGARWRAAVNRRFFDDLARRFGIDP